MDSADAALDRVFNKAHARCSLVTRKCFCRSLAVVLGAFVVAVLVVVIVLQNTCQLRLSIPKRVPTKHYGFEVLDEGVKLLQEPVRNKHSSAL